MWEIESICVTNLLYCLNMYICLIHELKTVTLHSLIKQLWLKLYTIRPLQRMRALWGFQKRCTCTVAEKCKKIVHLFQKLIQQKLIQHLQLQSKIIKASTTLTFWVNWQHDSWAVSTVVSQCEGRLNMTPPMKPWLKSPDNFEIKSIIVNNMTTCQQCQKYDFIAVILISIIVWATKNSLLVFSLGTYFLSLLSTYRP